MSESIVWFDNLRIPPPATKEYLVTTTPISRRKNKGAVVTLFYSKSRGWLNAETYKPVGATYVIAWAHLPAPWDFRTQRVISDLGDL